MKLTSAFWISGVAYDLLIEQKYDIINYIEILKFTKLPRYSEFLATFVVLNLFILIFFRVFKKLINNKENILLLSLASLAFTLLPYCNINLPWIDLIINTETKCYPLLPYMSFFFGGIYVAKYKPKFNTKIFLVMFLYSIAYFSLINHNYLLLASRYPASITFILGGYLFIYLYYYITKFICIKVEKNTLLDSISSIGEDTLSFLVISNLLIFITQYIIIEKSIKINILQTFIVYFIILLICCLYAKSKKKIYFIINNENKKINDKEERYVL